MSNLSDEQLLRIEEAYRAREDDLGIAAHAGISLAQLQELQNEHIRANDGWEQRMRLLWKEPIVQAKVNLDNSVLNGSIEDSKYFLERKLPKEWSARTQLNITDERPLVILPQLEQPREDIKEFRKIIDVDVATRKEGV